MNIKELEYILTIAEEKSLSRAAIKLCMAQSSLSQFLSLYEAEIGTQLFIRNSAGAKLTYSGELFLEYAKKAVNDFHQIQNQLWDINDLKSGIVHFAAASARGARLIPPVLKTFSEKYPGIHVEIIEENSNDCIPLLLSGRVDLCLMAISRSLTKLPTEFLRREEIYIAASKSHPILAYAKPFPDSPEEYYVEPEDAAQFDFILTSPNTVLRTITEDLFAEHHLTIRSNYNSLSLDFALAMVEQNLGLLFIHESLVKSNERVMRLSIGKKRLWRDLVIAYPTQQYRSKATRAFAAEIHQALDMTY